VLDGQPANQVEQLACFVERAEPELPRGVAVDDELSLVRRADFEEAEELPVRHAPHHETILFAIHLEAAFGHFDGASMRVHFGSACHHL
jgi:hypothetical protein